MSTSTASLDAVTRAMCDYIVAQLAERLDVGSRKRLMTAREAGAYIGRSPGAVVKLAREGQLPAVRHGRRTHFEISALDAWIERNRTE
jgi:excisionase family DNA binding protein